MINQAAIHDSLLQCAVQCREFVLSNRHNADLCSETIVLGIDCAELCRQMSVLISHKTEKSASVAKLCIRACESLLRQLTFSAEPSAQPLIDSCVQARRCCQTVVDQHMVPDQFAPAKSSVVCYGITLPVSVYRA
ncbi:hypothetical protein [Spirosoma rhododendri]|uniref:Four-helix bundle copper-binding protein n=1 Tax=Spirosoma rhododendri TaxID=2728024 RepID=A0A7L5DZE6_9BACT|nr:hypothetical protein [Spirosoma rhododendri]QJD80880.1 hypothetical protein HH216_22485 [Spirosoma rhododendri]